MREIGTARRSSRYSTVALVAVTGFLCGLGPATIASTETGAVARSSPAIGSEPIASHGPAWLASNGQSSSAAVGDQESCSRSFTPVHGAATTAARDVNSSVRPDGPDGALLASDPTPLATGNPDEVGVARERRFRDRIGGIRIPFIENRGQIDPAVAYYARTLAGTVYVTGDGQIVYSLPGNRLPETRRSAPPRAVPTATEGWSLTETPVSGISGQAPRGEESSRTRVNYFRANDPAGRATAVPTYRAVSLGEVWPGVAVSLHARGNTVEKLFTVHAGGDPSRIRMQVAGARSLRTNAGGALVVLTGLGDVAFSRPVAYQDAKGTRRQIDVAYEVRGGTYGFRLGDYDPTLPVVIDPLLQATYLGGSGDDEAHALAIDPTSGDVYVAGWTNAADFPGTAGGAQPAQSGKLDAFVARLSADLTTLIQAAYLGGSGDEFAYALVIHPTSGDVYVAGLTGSADFPGTTGGAQESRRGDFDAFVVRLSADLTTLAQSTYLGGSYEEWGRALAIHPTSGDVYLVGTTGSPDFPGTTGGAQPAAGGSFDAYVARLSADLTTLIQATYLGGSTSDNGFALAIHPGSGDVYVAGETLSTDFPGSTGGAQAAKGGYFDAFVARLTADLTTLTQATYLGGGDMDIGFALAIHPTSGDVYLAGSTYSTDFPGTAGGAQEASGGGGAVDMFVARLSADLTTLTQATYLGGSHNDDVFALAIHPISDEVYVAGETQSTDFPGTIGGAQDANGATDGTADAFIARLTADLTTLVQATYFGGSNTDLGDAFAIHPTSGDVYVAGSTDSADLFGTTGAAQQASGGGRDAFVARLTADLSGTRDLVVSALTAPATAAPGATITVSDTTENQGDGAAAASTTRVYLSTDAVLDAGDIVLRTRAVPALAGGATSTFSGSVVIPGGTVPGAYFLIAVADDGGAVAETNEGNNTRTKAITIGSDLVVSALTAPPMAAPGATMTVSDTTKNQGTGTAVASTTRVYLSTDAVLDAGDVVLRSRAVPALAAGASSTFSGGVVIPGGTAPGSYFLIAVADDGGVVPETNDDNNSRVKAITIGSDLVVSALTAPATAAPGATITVSDTTKNQGAGTAAASMTRIYLSTDAVVDAGDVVLRSRAVPALAAGASSTFSGGVVIPGGTAPGSYFLIAVADDGGVVPETNDDNNSRVKAITIGSDLVVSALTAPATATPGAPITVSDTTKNQGAGTAAASTTRVYLSTDAVLDAGDVALRSRAVPALAAGASSTFSGGVVIPGGTVPGAYFLIAVADTGATVPEVNDDNNSRVKAITIGSDLVVSTLTAPATAARGTTISVSDTTKNQGGGTAAPSTTRIYLSTDTVLDAGDIVLRSRAVPGLAAGAVSTSSGSVVIPAGTVPGSYFLIAVADADATVTEAVEDNNSRIKAITIKP